MFERRPAEQAIERLRGAKERVVALRNQLDADLQAAQAYTNRDLSSEGLARKRQEMAQAARSKAAPLIERERAILDADLATVARWAGQHRPRMGEDAAAVQRAGIRWEGIKAKLAAGIPLTQVLASADIEALLALETWGPDWLEVAHRQAEDPSKPEALREPVDVAGFRRAVAARMASVAAPEVAWALTAEHDAGVTDNAVRPWLDHLQAVGAGIQPAADAIEVAIASKLAERPAAQRAS